MYVNRQIQMYVNIFTCVFLCIVLSGHNNRIIIRLLTTTLQSHMSIVLGSEMFIVNECSLSLSLSLSLSHTHTHTHTPVSYTHLTLPTRR